jgi:hypothetical protein
VLNYIARQVMYNERTSWPSQALWVPKGKAEVPNIGSGTLVLQALQLYASIGINESPQVE